MPIEEELTIAARKRTRNRNAAGGSKDESSSQSHLTQSHPAAIPQVSEEPWDSFTSTSAGYLRIMRSRQDSSVFLRWKWTEGQYKGFYVMWVCEPGTVRAGLLGLAQKVWEVESGLRTPVRDRYTT